MYINQYILCSKTVDEFSLRGPYVRIIRYVVGIYILIFSSPIDRSRLVLSERKLSGERKLIFEGVKVEIALVAFQPRS